MRLWSQTAPYGTKRGCFAPRQRVSKIATRAFLEDAAEGSRRKGFRACHRVRFATKTHRPGRLDWNRRAGRPCRLDWNRGAGRPCRLDWGRRSGPGSCAWAGRRISGGGCDTAAPAPVTTATRWRQRQPPYDSTFSASEAASSSASGMKGSNRGSPSWDSSTIPVRTSTYW